MVIFFGIVFLGGALLAPWLYFMAQWGAETFPSQAWLQSLADKSFHRYVNRCLLILALVGLWPLVRSLGVRHWKQVGLGWSPLAGRHLAGGFGAGFLSLALVAFLAVAAGGRVWQMDHSWERWLGHLGGAAATAVVVAVLEELLFRGVLFGGLRRQWDWRVALLVSSGLYALLHFFQRPAHPATVDWTTGLLVLPQMMRGFVDPQLLVPGFFNLTLAGCLLALAYQRTGFIYWSIGLHAGWIFWLKSYGFLTRELPGAQSAWWGTRKLIDGWFAFVVLALLVPLVWRATRPAVAGEKTG